DCIATDHAPHHPDEKKCEFALAPNGSVGFETAFAVCFTALVRTGKLTLAQLVNKMSAAPAALLGRKASVAVGEAADFFLFDDAAKWTVDRAALHGKSKNTAFHGQTVTGRVTATYVAGEKII
ncbi:MAG: amidohydrolase family protein, partial [Clostridiales bacterium]|nr:amidohydrolase family protein [Clostridiales bacterium]